MAAVDSLKRLDKAVGTAYAVSKPVPGSQSASVAVGTAAVAATVVGVAVLMPFFDR
jgi:hypothetical protein